MNLQLTAVPVLTLRKTAKYLNTSTIAMGKEVFVKDVHFDVFLAL